MDLAAFRQQPDSYRASSLIASFGRQNKLESAFDIYKTLVGSTQIPDIGVFRALMNACIKCNQPRRVLNVLGEMTRFSVPLDGYCFGTLTKVCAKIGDSVTAKKLLEKMKRGELTFNLNVIELQSIDSSTWSRKEH